MKKLSMLLIMLLTFQLTIFSVSVNAAGASTGDLKSGISLL